METNIQKYKAFVETADLGSFTRAADVLSYSQSGVSRMVSDLEKEMNMVLLERGKNGVRLTSDGISLLPFAIELCKAYDRLEERVQELGGLQSGMIRIGAFTSAATHWLPHMIAEFRKTYPAIDYELKIGDYHEIEEWVAGGRVDCGLIKLPSERGLDCIYMAADRFKAVLPQGHPLAEKPVVKLEDLCREPFMMYEKAVGDEVSALLAQQKIEPHVVLTTWDDYTIMSMVEKGLGVSILPELILRRVPFRIEVRDLEIPLERAIGFALRDKGACSVAVRRFMEYLEYRNDG